MTVRLTIPDRPALLTVMDAVPAWPARRVSPDDEELRVKSPVRVNRMYAVLMIVPLVAVIVML